MPKYPIYEILKEASKNHPILLSERRLEALKVAATTVRSPEFIATVGSVSVGSALMLILRKILEMRAKSLFI